MNSNLQNAENVLVEKKMDNLFFVKYVEHYNLPIIEHNVTIYFEAREKYNILEQQALQFISISLDSNIELIELEELLGIQDFELASLLEKLEVDGTINLSGGSVVLTEQGKISVLDGFSPSRQMEKQFGFYYEPVTAYLVEDIQLIKQYTNKIHPIVHTESYEQASCPLLEEDKIIAFYKKVMKQNLLHNSKDFKLQRLVHEVNETNKAIGIQSIELYSKEKNSLVHSIWNANNNQLIRLV